MEYRYRDVSEMKDSGVEWIGKIPKDWQVNRLRNLGNITTSSVDKKINEGEKIVKLVNYVDVYNSKTKEIRNCESYMKVSAKDNQITATNLLKGDVLFTPSSETIHDIGYSAVVMEDLENTLYSYHIIRLRFKGYVDLNFKKYMFWSNSFLNYLSSRASGTTRKTLSLNDFKDNIVVMPSIKQQEKIAKFLDKKTSQFDLIISKKEALIEKLEEAKKSLISELVTGKVKAVKTTDGYELVQRSSDEMKDSGIEWLGDIPKNWEVKRIKYLMYECKGKSETGTEEPLSMSQKYGLIKTSDMENIPNQATSLVGNKIVRVNDLVFNKLKPHLGVFSVSKYDGIVSPDYAVYGAKKNVNIKYLEYLFKTTKYINEFKKYSTGVGAGLTRLYTDQLFNIQAIVPTYDEQCIIEEIITMKIVDMAETIAKTKYQIEKLKEAKQSLISEAVTGKIEVLN